MRTILLVGQPASGKGTQAKLLQENLGMKVIAMGEILREHKRNNTEIGRMATQLDKEGKLMPDDIIIKIMCDTIKNNKDHEKGLVLDGVVRTVEQAKKLDTLMYELGMNDLEIINLNVSPKVIIDRALERGKTSGRPEDLDERIIRKRINVFREKTQPVLYYYGDRVITLSGKMNPDLIHDMIVGFREKYNKSFWSKLKDSITRII